MRVVDLDRDMSDVIPTGMSPDSEFLFDRMTEATLHATCADEGRLVLDVASGVGQDSVALAKDGATVIGAEPSARMTEMAKMFSAEHVGEGQRGPEWVSGWADALPFAADAFDASFCKGAMDHFDDPEKAIAEMARVTKRDGRVVLAIANFDSLAQLQFGVFQIDLREMRFYVLTCWASNYVLSALSEPVRTFIDPFIPF